MHAGESDDGLCQRLTSSFWMNSHERTEERPPNNEVVLKHPAPGLGAQLTRVLLPREGGQAEAQGLHTCPWAPEQTEVRRVEQRPQEILAWDPAQLRASPKGTPRGLGWGREGAIAHLALRDRSHLRYWSFPSCVIEF